MDQWTANHFNKIGQDAAKVAVNQAMARKGIAKGGDKGKGKGGKATWGKGQYGGMKGKGLGKGKIMEGKNPCFRCWGTDHLQSYCTYLTSGAICGKCGKEGHADYACVSKHTAAEKAERVAPTCSCCGKSGHAKKTAQTKIPYVLFATKPVTSTTFAGTAKASNRRQPTSEQLLLPRACRNSQQDRQS